MSAVKWAFAVGALLIGAAVVGVFAQMASQVFVTGNFIMPEKPKTEAEVVTTQPAEPVPSESVEKPAESAKPVETVPEPVPVVEPAQEPEPAVESVPVEHTQGQIVDYDLVSYWKFDGGEGGLDNYGTSAIRGIVSGTESYVEGKIGQAFDFTGQNYITIPKYEELNSPSFSVTFWVNPNELRTQGIMDKVPIQSWTNGWRIFMNGQSGNIEFDAYNEQANITTPPIPVGKWSFVAITYDGISQTAKIYLDGVLAAQTSGVDMQNSLPNRLIMASLEEARLDGKLDDVRFYERILFDDEVQEIFES